MTPLEKGVEFIDLKCTNPNYLLFDTTIPYKSGIGYSKNPITFISREQYLSITKLSSSRFFAFESRCGKCLACRLYRSYVWANRLLAESYISKYSYFITLTFADESYNHEELLKNPARQGQLFMKRLRKKFKGVKLRYYMTGELGTNTNRFHYHFIIFSPVHLFPDMVKFKNLLYTSGTLRKLWPYGHHALAFADYDTMRYTANYITSGQKKSIINTYSRNLGSEYIEKQKKQDTYIINGKFSPLPQKYKKKYQELTPLEQYEKRKKFLDLVDISRLDKDKEIKDEIRKNKLQKTLYRK
jgi:hypothetical protein